MNKIYLLIYYYHDTNVYKFNTLQELKEELDFLKEEYGNYSDFRYEIYGSYQLDL